MNLRFFIALPLLASATCFGADSGYVDPASCAPCHRDIASTYAQTGMGRSFRSVDAKASLPEFDGSSIHHEASDQDFKPYRRPGGFYLRRTYAGSVFEPQVNYVFGSGNHARSYLHRTRNGKLIELPLTWYAEKGGHWGMSPAFDRPDHLGFSREITYRCLFCHNGYPAVPAVEDFWDGASRFPASLPEGIDCQRCHGPGHAHVDAARLGASSSTIRGAIVNPARLGSERQIEVCMQCHLETTSAQLPPALLREGRGVFSYRPGEPLSDYMLHFDHASGTGHDDKFELVSSAYRLRQSRCFVASKGALTCTKCHDPHKPSQGAEAALHYTQVCLGCHAQKLSKLASHLPRTACTECHMPRRRPSDAIHIEIADHLIQARPRFANPVQEQHDGNTRPYRGEVVSYYPTAMDKTPEAEIAFAVAQVKQQSNLTAGIERLRTLIERYRPEGGDAYYELAEAYWHVGQADRALRSYEQAASHEPRRWTHLLSLGTALAANGQFDRAVDVTRQAQSLAPNETTVLLALGEIYTQQGKLADAESAIRAAIVLNPEMAEGANNLGTTVLKQGRLSEAEAALQEAVRLRPDSAVTHLNLGLALTAAGKSGGARLSFAQAVKSRDPQVRKAATELLKSVQRSEADALLALIRKAPRLALEKSELRIAGVELGFPSAVAMDPSGVIYVLHRGENADPVVAVNAQGRVLNSWGKGLYKIPHSIRIDPEGNVWTVDSSSSMVYKFTPKGEKLMEIAIGGQPQGKGAFNGATDIAFAPNGHLFISDGYGNARILEYTADGKRTRQWGSAGNGPGQFAQPHGITIDEQGVIYVADRQNGRIQRFNLDGLYLGEWSNLGMVTSISFAAGSLWIGTQQRDEPTSSPGWLMKIDRRNGAVLGVIESYRGHHMVNVTSGGELLSGARPDTVLWFRKPGR